LPPAGASSSKTTLGEGVKTQPSTGAADRAARRARVEAERRALELEEQRARFEQELARARVAELGGQLDVLDQECQAQQRSIRRDELSAQVDELERYLQLARVAEMEVPTSRQDRAEGYRAQLTALDRYLDREADAEQDRRWHETDAALRRRLYDGRFRRSWDARHPGGVDRCPCDGCRAWRREPPR
jgi:hypothetical protein